MPLFYRVETRTGEGPYRRDKDIISILYGSAWGRSTMKYMETHPIPNNDELLAPVWDSMTYDERQEFRFGFDSLDQCFGWFRLKKERTYLEKEHFYINVYNVRKMYVGKWQSVAIIRNRKIVESIPFRLDDPALV